MEVVGLKQHDLNNARGLWWNRSTQTAALAVGGISPTTAHATEEDWNGIFLDRSSRFKYSLDYMQVAGTTKIFIFGGDDSSPHLHR